MKTINSIIILLLFCSTIIAQDNKYFQSDSGEIIITLTSLKKQALSARNIVESSQQVSRFRLTKEFAITIDPIFKEIFGFPVKVDPNDFKSITISIELDNNCNIYEYSFTFPTKKKKDLPQWEKKLYQFGEHIKEINFLPFIDIWDKDKFVGTSLTLNMYDFYRYSEQSDRMLFID